MTIIEGLFDSPQTMNGHVKKGTGSLIRLPGVTTVKWWHIGAALMFLSHTPSLLLVAPSDTVVSCILLHLQVRPRCIVAIVLADRSTFF